MIVSTIKLPKDKHESFSRRHTSQSSAKVSGYCIVFFFGVCCVVPLNHLIPSLCGRPSALCRVVVGFIIGGLAWPHHRLASKYK